jgi:hypothetical protein
MLQIELVIPTFSVLSPRNVPTLWMALSQLFTQIRNLSYFNFAYP